jgi:phage terminase large subunit-like protein
MGKKLSSLIKVDKNKTQRKKTKQAKNPKHNKKATKRRVKKKTSRPKKKPPTVSVFDSSQLTDYEIIDMKPPPTFYNSVEGSVIIYGKKYLHGEIGPDGNPVNCPPLTDEEWGKKYEMFTVKEKVWNKEKTDFKIIKVNRPPVFNPIDFKLMKILNTERKVLILIFRGGHKSSNVTRKVKRLVLDEGMRVAYFSSTTELTKDYSALIQEELTNNAQVLRDYGFIIDTERGNAKGRMFWAHQKGTASRDPGMTIGSAQGKSRVGGHPDWLILDDPVGEEVEGSEAQLKAIQRWFTKQIYPMAMGFCNIVIVGTMKDPNDLYNYIEGLETFEVIKIRAIMEWPNNGQKKPGTAHDKNKWFYYRTRKNAKASPKITGVAGLIGGKVGMNEYEFLKWDLPGRVQYYIDNDSSKGYDKERMSMQEFLLIRRDIGKDAFECEYQMRAIKVGAGYLKFSNMKPFTYDALPFPKEYLEDNTVAMFDQAFGESNRSDWNCIFVSAKYLDLYYILDIFVWRGGGVIKKVKMLRATKQKYPFIGQMGVEAGQINAEDTVFIQGQLGDEMDIVPIYQNKPKKADEYGVEPVKLIIEFTEQIPSGKKAKYTRIINQWGTKLTVGKIYIRAGINQDAIEEFENEHNFPGCKHVDVLDAGGSSFDLCDEGGVGSLGALIGG